MTERQTALIVLAAGMGTRMASDMPKVLHPVGGLPLLAHALNSGSALSPAAVVVVTGHGAADVAAAAVGHCPSARIAHQAEQRGTAHAVAQARDSLADFTGDAIVLYGDTPFISPDTLHAMATARVAGADLVILGFEAADPGRYGRLIVDEGRLRRIVEYKDATEDERRITLCNSGVVLAPATLLFDLISQVTPNNKAGEYYLTDIVGLANDGGLRCAAVTCDESETLGINTRAELARAEAVFQSRRRAAMMAAGVTLIAPETVFFAADTVIGRDTVIEPNVIFGPGVRIEGKAHIRAFSYLEGARVGTGAVVGPYARLRPGADLAEDSHIGNFVEVKNARIGAGAKANHLTYIGDATVGPGSNIGAGTITCNYDGVMKHRTTIGARAFIGSNTLLVAPVSVGNDALTAAGSVITADVPDGALSVARARQEIKPGLAIRLRDRLRALKAAQKGR